MANPCFRIAAVGVVVSGILTGPAPARAQGVAALSAVGFPIIGGAAVELSKLRRPVQQESGTAVDVATALSQVGQWSTVGVVVTGTVATLVLRDAGGTTQASLVVPSRAVAAAGLRAGDRILTTATDAGTILHKGDRVLAFVAGDGQQHLVQHDPVAAA